MKEFKEIFEALGSRLKSPLFGYYLFAFIAANWRPIFYIFFSDESALDRISYFESHTSQVTLLWIPLTFSAIAAIAYPWINCAFLYLTIKPTDIRNSLQANTENRMLSKKMELEEQRNKLRKQREQSILQTAKIEEELEQIESEEVKEKALQELASSRQETLLEDRSVEELLSLSAEEILELPIADKSLEVYTLTRFPKLSISHSWQKQLLKDINRIKYQKISDINNALDASEEFLSQYASAYPQYLTTGTDHITKALGFNDLDFRRTHNFAKETLQAYKAYEEGDEIIGY